MRRAPLRAPARRRRARQAAVWIGVYPLGERVAAVRDELDVPVGIVPFAMVALGHPAVRKEPGARYEPGCVHRERW